MSDGSLSGVIEHFGVLHVWFRKTPELSFKVNHSIGDIGDAVGFGLFPGETSIIGGLYIGFIWEK